MISATESKVSWLNAVIEVSARNAVHGWEPKVV